MHRIFASAGDVGGGFVALGERDMAHLRALRIRGGESFVVCDGAGTDYVCRLAETGGDGARAEIVQTLPSAGEPAVKATVYLAFAKGERLELAVQKCVELGASAFCLFPCARIVARPGADKLPRRLERLAAISKSAAEQSGRGIIPPVRASGSLEDALREAASAQLALFLYENETGLGLREALDVSPAPGTLSIITGPEGGFEPGEAAAAKSAGCLTVGLGARILRCDTAPAAALACAMMQFDEMA
jgi:16S rRNA (uracil1498-N3)-methyltransferase